MCVFIDQYYVQLAASSKALTADWYNDTVKQFCRGKIVNSPNLTPIPMKGINVHTLAEILSKQLIEKKKEY